MSYLPNELLESIFAQFTILDDLNHRQSVQTLSSICLASQRLYLVAQPLLYKSIRIDVRSDQPQLLAATLKTKPQLAQAIRKLDLECTVHDYSFPAESMYRLRQFLEDVLPLSTGLLELKSNRRVCTTKLVDSVLFKTGNGYHMGIPTDLNNLRSLELLADSFVFKYHFLLRLPRLRRVVMHSTKVWSALDDDIQVPNDWGWSSHSIKELVLRLNHRTENTGEVLALNSLQALSRSLPCLESLRIEHIHAHVDLSTGTVIDPAYMRRLTVIFAAQLATTLRRLEILDGPMDLCCPRYRPMLADDVSVIDKIQASKLEKLSVDWQTLFLGPIDPTDYTNHAASPLTILRHVVSPLTTLRHVVFRYFYLPGLSPFSLDYVLGLFRLRFPSLERFDLHLVIQSDPLDRDVLLQHSTAFRSAGIEFNVHEHRHIEQFSTLVARRTGSITISGRPSALPP